MPHPASFEVVLGDDWWLQAHFENWSPLFQFHFFPAHLNSPIEDVQQGARCAQQAC